MNGANNQLNESGSKMISCALSAHPGKVKVFQFGQNAAGKLYPSNYFESSDPSSSSIIYDPEVETEFSRLRD